MISPHLVGHWIGTASTSATDVCLELAASGMLLWSRSPADGDCPEMEFHGSWRWEEEDSTLVFVARTYCAGSKTVRPLDGGGERECRFLASVSRGLFTTWGVLVAEERRWSRRLVLTCTDVETIKVLASSGIAARARAGGATEDGDDDNGGEVWQQIYVTSDFFSPPPLPPPTTNPVDK